MRQWLGIFVLSVGIWFGGNPVQSAPTDWQTLAEVSQYQKTARYPEMIAYAQRLAAASADVSVQTIGKSPEGRDIIVIVVSKDHAFSPSAARATGKEIVLVNAGIHPGEIEGKDAGLALIRDMVITGKQKALLDHAILLLIPIFGVDGHERFGAYNRINQNGPQEMGWRTTAQNYNLNRDFMKVDSPEMRAWQSLFQAWLPDMVVDSHTTDGMDYQYDITYSLEMYANQAIQIITWQKEAFNQHIVPALEQQGHIVCPYYLTLRDEKDPLKGFDDSASTPRYSTGYAALQNRPGLLLETHMLKDYKNRVIATYDLIQNLLAYINQTPGQLRKAVDAADAATIASGNTYDPKQKFPLTFEVTAQSVPFSFAGVAFTRELSAISGSFWVKYDARQPKQFTIPFYNKIEPKKTIAPPLGYVVPVYLTEVIERLNIHHLQYQVLDQPTKLTVETYQFSKVTWEPRPFENHHQIKDLVMTPIKRTITYPAGSVKIMTNQRAAKVLIHLLEPDAPDSLLRWGYLDPIFEQKEYAEDYVMEKMARQMLARDPKLQQEFEEKISADPDFAHDPQARLNFFYQRTPYYDDRLNIYPIGRIVP